MNKRRKKKNRRDKHDTPKDSPDNLLMLFACFIPLMFVGAIVGNRSKVNFINQEAEQVYYDSQYATDSNNSEGTYSSSEKETGSNSDTCNRDGYADFR